MFKRRLLEVVKVRFAEEPVIILEGARAVGKSTIVQAVSAAPTAGLQYGC